MEEGNWTTKLPTKKETKHESCKLAMGQKHVPKWKPWQMEPKRLKPAYPGLFNFRTHLHTPRATGTRPSSASPRPGVFFFFRPPAPAATFRSCAWAWACRNGSAVPTYVGRTSLMNMEPTKVSHQKPKATVPQNQTRVPQRSSPPLKL